MIILHHLNFSRSTRVLWLLEELGLDYELRPYERDQNFRAPAALSTVHPLGKAPVLVDDDLVLAESGTILRYLEQKYSDGRLVPAPGTPDRAIHDEWLDFVESSAALPIMMTLLGGMTGGLPPGLAGFTAPELTKTLTFISNRVADRDFLMGDRLTLADIQMSYLVAALRNAGQLKAYPAIAAYLDRLEATPGLKKAIEIGGQMTPPAGADEKVGVDINRASADELDALEGLRGHGHEIVRYRGERGRFTDTRQLDEVPGLAGVLSDEQRNALSVPADSTAQ